MPKLSTNFDIKYVQNELQAWKTSAMALKNSSDKRFRSVKLYVKRNKNNLTPEKTEQLYHMLCEFLYYY